MPLSTSWIRERTRKALKSTCACAAPMGGSPAQTMLRRSRSHDRLNRTLSSGIECAAGADGGSHGPAVPHAVPEIWGGARRLRNVDLGYAAVGFAEVATPHGSCG